MASWEDAWMEVDDKAVDTRPPQQDPPKEKTADAYSDLAATMERCKPVLTALLGKVDAEPFADAVDKELYPWYYEVVADPMHLLGVKTKLEAGEYSEPEVSHPPEQQPRAKSMLALGSELF
jgi:hypothetical protein